MGTKPTRTPSPRTRVRPHAPARTGLADALFKATQQRVLGLLFGQPERSFFATELIGLAGAGRGAVQRELRRLEESGLVTTRRVGNQKHYRANATAPIFTELHAIITKTGGPAAALRTALATLGTCVRFAALYGSVAKRRDHAHSDIDLLVVADDLTLERLYAALAPAEEQLGRTISPTLYTAAEFRKRRANQNPFLANVLTGEHQVLIGDEHAAGGPR